ncbi:hypothetical protein DL769_006163 [Monosporascus sp. CRB-8-3]|nr:hypothetical protein DL769_006163 [Monosporascus sp. CRB-8-3]
MPYAGNMRFVSASAFLFFAGSLASPTRVTRANLLHLRSIESYNDCSADQESKLRQDFADAVNFARHAFDDLDENSPAYTNYFRTEAGNGLEEDIEHARSLWSTVASNNDPTNPSYTFTVRCAPDGDAECGDRTTNSWAITDAQPEANGTPRQMKICPFYFTDAATRQSSTSYEWIPNPKRTQRSWCRKEARFRDFSMGGLTLLHEMTHLDALTHAAGYPERHDENGDFNTHATDDVQGVEPGNNPPQQARNLAQIWKDGREGDYDELTEPYRNAENLAASALEHYVMKFCELDHVDI